MKAKEKIIIIDDDDDVCDSLSLFLNKVGYKTETAQTGQEGINKITKEFYIVALLDIKLPDIEGTELLKRLKEKHPKMDVIIMTGNASLNSAVQALNNGASGYILKPINLENLLTNLKNSIEKQHLIAEKQQTEQKLKDSEEKYRELYENAPNAYFSVNPDKSIKGCNQPACELLGYNKKEILTMKVFDLYYNSSEGLQKAKRLFKQFLEGKNIQDVEIQMKHKNGNPFWVSLTVKPIKNQKGEIVESRSMVINITERKETEEALKNSEHNLRERVKELTCLYSISRLIEDDEISIEQFFTKLLTFIPPAWQFPEVTCARITYEGKIFKTENFQEAQWKQIAEIKENGKKAGILEVIYFEKMPEFDEGPFFKEERDLINVIAKQISFFIERKKSEKKNNRLAAIVDSSDDAIIGKRLDGIITSWNTGATKIYGYMAKEVIGKPINIMVPPDRQDEVTQILEKIKRRERVDHFETDRVTKDGAKIPVSLTISPIEDKQGKVLGASTIARNITERKRNEKQITDLAKFPSENPNPVLRVTRESVIYTNKKGESLFNVKEGDKIPRLLEDEVSTALDMNTVNKVEIELNNHTYSLNITPIMRAGYANIYGMDITERKKAEQEIKESEAKFRALFNNTNDSIFIHDGSSQFIEINKTACERLGYTREELLRLSLKDIIPPGYKIDLQTNIKTLYEKGRIVMESEHLTKDGNIIPVEISSRIFNYWGKSTIISLARDITERNKDEEMINNLAKFPSENPSPVLRINRNEIIYANKVSQDLFKIEEGDKTPMLLKDMVNKVMKAKITKTAEIELNDHIYSFVITPIPEENYVNVYGMDTTERKIAERAIQNRNKEILMLLDASRAVLQYSDFEIAQKRIFNCCNNLIGADAGYVAVLNPSKKEYHKIFVNPRSLTCEVDPDLPMPIRGMLAKVMKSKKALSQNDFSNTDWINFLPKGHIPLKNVLIAPLIINDEVNGFMGLTGREGGFTDEEARVLTAFAELASISLFNSQTLEALEKSEQKYRSLSSILEQKVEERTIELKESEEKVQNMITNISDVLLESEPNGILTYISPQIKNIIEYQSEELIGLNFMDFVHIEDINSFKETASKALKTQKPVSIECRLKHKKGYFVPISARWSLVEINNELKVFGLISDNTERKNIDDMIKREIKQLKELDQIRNDLIRRISHELNTPLISILNGSQYLLDFKNNKMSDDVSNIVKIIYQGGYRLREMVNNLITAYELETEQLIFKIKRENLIPIIKKCVEDLIFQAEKRKIFINLELPTDLNVDVDKEMIKKAILNLLSNAVKNTLPNGNIFIKSIEHHNFIDIIIRDTGVGLTDKEIPILFKKFGKIERYGKGMDVDIEGPGLGLYIANEIVKLHIGEILVKSKGRNKGSTFILRLFLN